MYASLANNVLDNNKELMYVFPHDMIKAFNCSFSLLMLIGVFAIEDFCCSKHLKDRGTEKSIV